MWNLDRVTNISPNGTLTNRFLLNQKWISKTIMWPVNLLLLWQIIVMLLFFSLFSCRPLLIHFRERGQHDRWDTSCAHVLLLWLQRPIHTAQGAICAVFLLGGVQGRGMETRQLAVASFPIQRQTQALSLYRTINLQFLNTVSSSTKWIMPFCIVSKSNKLYHLHIFLPEEMVYLLVYCSL